MTTRRPYYTMLQKVLDARHPVPTIDGGIHRIDFTVEEYAVLRNELFETDGSDGENTPPAKEG